MNIVNAKRMFAGYWDFNVTLPNGSTMYYTGSALSRSDPRRLSPLSSQHVQIIVTDGLITQISNGRNQRLRLV
jgi:hypothetical protein